MAFINASERRQPVLIAITDEQIRAHRLLGLQLGAGRREIQRAYHRAVAEYHPDKVAALGQDLRALAEAKTKEINQAYDVLKSSQRDEIA